MITELAGASLWSEDRNNLLPFSRDVLGLEVSVQTAGFVVLAGLGLGTHSQGCGRNTDPARHMVGLTTHDTTTDWKRSQDAGGELVEDPPDYSNLWIVTLKEPEGKMVQRFQSSGGA
jgi:hypothetical protein